MEDFERQLKKISLRGPSAGLDSRIRTALASPPAHPEVDCGPPRRPLRLVSARWALAAALLVGLLGFLAGRLAQQGNECPPSLAAGEGSAAPSVTVHIVYEGHDANPFDCTVAADDGLRPLKDIKIESHSGV